ncbi:MAG: ComF family protein [Sulfurospirillum sp.]|nr:MAG: ComF family protein [Sulfurospirillum sp.]
MRCLLCQNFSFTVICNSCQKLFLQPYQTIRVLHDGFKVYSFYRYGDIAVLLKTKHTHIGAAVYRILAKNAMQAFKERFDFDVAVDIIPVDDIPKSGYAHTAILANVLASKYLQPYYGSLRAQNDVSYSAKTLHYRQTNPRDFMYSGKRNENVILVDDIITTGTTINEAKNEILKCGAKPLFAVTLADAREL